MPATPHGAGSTVSAQHQRESETPSVKLKAISAPASPVTGQTSPPAAPALEMGEAGARTGRFLQRFHPFSQVHPRAIPPAARWESGDKEHSKSISEEPGRASRQMLFLEEKQALVGRCSIFPRWEIAAPAQGKGFGAGSTVPTPG